MDDNPWFERVENTDVPFLQGDLFVNLEIPVTEILDKTSVPSIKSSIKLNFEQSSYIILSQSCDLEPANEKEVGSVILAPVAKLSDFINKNLHFHVKDKVTALISNSKLGLISMVPPADGQFGDELLIASLYHPRIIDLASFRIIAGSEDFKARYTLSHPYREYVANHFGNMFSRVALPEMNFPSETQKQKSITIGQSFNPEILRRDNPARYKIIYPDQSPE